MVGNARALGALLTLAAGCSFALAAAAQPDAGEVWFEYRLAQEVVNGGGIYEGWSDRLTANGRYEESADRIRARYRWQYRSPDDAREGGEDRLVFFSPATRSYTAPREIDLDDYDDRAPAPEGRFIWWRIPTELTPGDEIRILDERFTVVGPVPPSAATHDRPSVLLEQRAGIGARNDAYGDYRTTFVDQYWFDAETGYFLREVYREHDIGALEGSPASFDVEETIEVSAASYVPGTVSTWADAPPAPAPGGTRTIASTATSEARGLLAMLTRNAFWVALLVLGAIAVFVFVRSRRPRQHDFDGKVERLDAPEKLPSDLASQTTSFGDVLPHLVKQTLRAGLPVALAKNSVGSAGIALGAPPGEAATIFARDTAACEALRREIGATHFFSEVRHEHAFATRAAAAKTPGVDLAGNHAYNVLETHEILKLEPLPPDASYDRECVRRAKAEDLPAVIAVADQVYGTSCKAWIEAASATGDVILVATKDDAIVGLAMVSVSGTTARFHGLSVAAAHRGKGLGKELNRARVRVAFDLGAERAIVEVASWNVASLEVARALGFSRVGSMYVETAAAAPVEQKFRRR